MKTSSPSEHGYSASFPNPARDRRRLCTIFHTIRINFETRHDNFVCCVTGEKWKRKEEKNKRELIYFQVSLSVRNGMFRPMFKAFEVSCRQNVTFSFIFFVAFVAPTRSYMFNRSLPRTVACVVFFFFFFLYQMCTCASRWMILKWGTSVNLRVKTVTGDGRLRWG